MHTLSIFTSGLLADVKRCRGDPPWYLTYVTTSGDRVTVSNFRPYFYIVCPRSEVRKVEKYVRSIAERLLANELRKPNLVQVLKENDIEPETLLEEPCIIEETDYTAWIFDKVQGRYVRAPRAQYSVLKVKLWIPRHVRKIADILLEGEEVEGERVRPLKNVVPTSFNIVYTARALLDTPGINILNIVPIYYDLDLDLFDKLSKVTYTVYDVEVLNNGKLYIVSFLDMNLTEEVTRDKIRELFNRVETYEITSSGEGDVDAVIDKLRRVQILVGYNNLAFDDKIIVNRLQLLSKEEYSSKVVLDISVYARKLATALGIGLASLGLADVMIQFLQDLPIEVVETKLRSVRMLKSRESAVQYNRNDVVAEAVLAQSILQTLFAHAGLAKLPTGTVYLLRPGKCLEYALVHWFEIHGEVVEARKVFETVEERLYFTGEKVYTVEDVQVFARYLHDRLWKIEDPNQIKKLADEILKKIVKPRALAEARRRGRKSTRSTGGEEGGGELFFVGKILHVDVDMMYPTKILHDKIDPCCLVSKEWKRLLPYAEDAVFDVDNLPAPFYAFAERLYSARAWIKQLIKQAKERGDKETAEKLKVISNALKPFLNSLFGVLGQSKGYVHLAHPIVCLKIYHSTIRDEIALLLYAEYLNHDPEIRKLLQNRKIVPLYGDTDSLFVLVPDNVDVNLVYEKLSNFARSLGYSISLEGVYDFMYIYAKKSYCVGNLGQSVKVKGQLLGRIKMLTSPLVRAWLLEALKNNDIMYLYDKVMNEDDILLLVPSLSKKFVDLFLLDPETVKRKSEEELAGRIRVVYPSENPEERRRGYLKSLQLANFTLARLCALAINYGRADKKSGKFVIDLGETSPEDIADLRTLLIVETSSKLSGKYSIVVDMEREEYLVTTCETRGNYYILEDPYSGKILKIPLSYRMGNFAKVLQGDTYILERTFILRGLELNVRIVKKRLTPREVKYYVLHDIDIYLRWSGLCKILKNYSEFHRKVKELAVETIIATS